jgi:hypothetical protein
VVVSGTRRSVGDDLVAAASATMTMIAMIAAFTPLPGNGGAT